jgi:hypothetical protein
MKQCVSLSSLLLFALMVFLPGCTQVFVTADPFIGVPAYPPTDPASVQILRQYPERSFNKIGELFVEPSGGNPPITKIEQALQQQGAKMGADAVVITVDRITRSGADWIGGGWAGGGGEVMPMYGHAVRAIAIKYK